jgi:serine/threonine-protein kinase PknK
VLKRKAARGGRPGGDQAFDPSRPPRIPGLTGLTPIGGGGSATVYQGLEPALNRKVAVKVLHTPLRDTRGREAFSRECALAGQIGQHPSAANIYTSGFDSDRPYIVMQYYVRGSLASRLASGLPLQVPEVLSTGIRIASALQFAHDLGILHRDVKPENILCDAFGEPVIADFGIATDRDAATMTLHHAMTPAYAAPEVLRYGGGWPVSDVWSLAATLYALLAGHPPFWDRSRPDPRANARATAGPLPPIARPDVPGHVAETLARALIGAQDDRTPSARRLAEELAADEARLGLASTPIHVDPDARPTVPAPGPIGPASTPGAVIGPATGVGPVPGAAAGPAPGAVTDPGIGRAAPTPGVTTTGGPSPFNGMAFGRPSPGAPPADPPSGVTTGTGPPGGRAAPYNSPPTGRLTTGHAYRLSPDPVGEGRGRRPRVLIAAGAAAVVLVLAGLAYVALGHRHTVAPSVPGTRPSPTARPSATGRATTQAAAPPAPARVRARADGATAARIAWRNTVSATLYPQVVISLGAGYTLKSYPNDSPQVITGLKPDQPYCFAVGYVYDAVTNPKVSYSAEACINGGVPSPAGG